MSYFESIVDGNHAAVSLPATQDCRCRSLTSMVRVPEIDDCFEGSIVRAVRRLRELLDELKSAAKAIGNDELYAKFGDACDLVQRDIIFVNSLYTA